MARLVDLWAELKKGRIYECSLRDANFQLDGLQDGPNIYIDPRPAVLETVVHELLHRKFPSWSEREVTRKARRLVLCMDEATKVRWWKAYNRIKRRRRPVEVED